MGTPGPEGVGSMHARVKKKQKTKGEPEKEIWCEILAIQKGSIKEGSTKKKKSKNLSSPVKGGCKETREKV